MELLLKQKNKDLYSGEFEIIDNNQIIGTISFEGQLGSMEVNLNGSFYDKTFFFKIRTYSKCEDKCSV